MDLSIFLPYIGAAASSLLTYFLTKKKNNADVEKVKSETDLVYAEKFKEELQSTKEFRNLLISDNKSLKLEINELKLEIEKLKDIVRNLNNINRIC